MGVCDGDRDFAGALSFESRHCLWLLPAGWARGGCGSGGPVSSYTGAPEGEKSESITNSAGEGVGPWERGVWPKTWKEACS